MPETPGQKIQRQIAAIKSQGGSDADVATFLSSHPDVQQVSEEGAPQPSQSPTGSSLVPLAQGLTFGAADEILGGINGANEFLHGGSFKHGYGEGVAKVRGVGQQFASEHPVASAALNVAGSIAPVVATGGALALERGAAWGARAIAASKAGAKYGAITGALSGDNGVVNRAKGALEGGAIGAALGPVVDAGLSATVGGARALGIPQAISRGAAALADRLPDGSIASGLRTLSGTVGASGQASSIVNERLQSEGLTPEALANRVQGLPSDKPEILADLSPEVAKLTKSVAKQPGAGRALINKVLGTRAAGTRARVLEDLGATSPVAQHVEGMIRARSQSAAELFPAAEKAGAAGVDDPVVNEILSRPTFRAALPLAQKMAADEGVELPTRLVIPDPTIPGIPPEKWRAAAIASGVAKEVPVPDVRTIHFVDRAVRAMMAKGFEGKSAAVDPSHAAVLRDALGQLRDRMTALVPEFGRAIEDYSARSAEIEAVKTGSNILSYAAGTKTPPQALGHGDPLALRAVRRGITGLEATVDNMTPAHRSLFRMGAQGAVADAVNRVPSTLEGSTAPVLRRVFSNSPESLRWQRLLFDSPEESRAFQAQLGRERVMAATKARMGGSDTAENLSEQAALNPSSGILGAFSHPVTTARSLLDAGGRTAKRKLYEELGRRLSVAGQGPLVKMLGQTAEEAQLSALMGKGGAAVRNTVVAARGN